MTKIHSYLLVLLLFFSCNTKEIKEEPQLEVLKSESFIPNLSDKLQEISGIIVYDNLFWGFNDSGGKDELYGFTKTGEIQKTIEVKDAKNRDWESIAQDDQSIFIGDFGNNGGARKDLCIYKINKGDIEDIKEQKVDSKKIAFRYTNQTRFEYQNNTTPYDCEALVEFGDSLYIFSKNWQDFTSEVYKLSKESGDYNITPYDSFNVDGFITGADISPDKKHLALVGYKNYKSFIWIFSFFPNDQFFKGQAHYFYLEDLDGSQTEGISFYGNNTLLVSTERTGLYKQQVYRINIEHVVDGTHSN